MDKSDLQYFVLEDGVCLAAFAAAAGRGWAMPLGAASRPLDGATVAAALAELRRRLGAGLDGVVIKLVGSERPVQQALALLGAAGIVPRAVAARPARRVEVLFNTRTGRLRLAAELPPGPAPQAKIRVLIVDDSPTIRRLVRQVLGRDPGLEIAGDTGRPSEVERLIAELRPDVLVLDLNMPEMNGVELLRHLLPRTPVPTVLFTSLARDAGPLVLAALEAGAVDYVRKPGAGELAAFAPLLVERVRAAAAARVRRAAGSARPAPAARRLAAAEGGVLIAIGASTGGVEALRDVLTRLPAEIPPILVVQHIPPLFSAALAERLDGLCPFRVKEAEDGDLVEPNRVLIAPGGRHMRLVGKGAAYAVMLSDAPPRRGHRPSVDELFASIAPLAGSRTFGVLLTGMGADGAAGLLALRQAGARTVAQDEASCVVFGMPREAIKLGAAEVVRPLERIPETLFGFLEERLHLKRRPA